jgi:hypothetical protein
VRWKPFRIFNPWLKLLAIVVAFGLRLIILWFIPLDFAPLAISLFAAASGLALIYGATRVFRVREEPLVAPRAWWRATGRPTAGFVIAAYIVFSVLVTYIRAALDGATLHAVDLVLTGLSTGLLAAFYLNSSIRLLRSPRDQSLLPTRRSDW